MKASVILILITVMCFPLLAQFEPAAGVAGSNAVHVQDAAVSFWADSVVYTRRGWLDISDTTLGKASHGTESQTLGVADGTFYSLGDSGSIVLTFPYTIYNEDGDDFAVFENGIASLPFEEDMYFLELGRVAGSYDGVNFTEFESTSLTDTNTPLGPFGYINVREINNLAGKFETNYGTPFDLDELAIDSIRYVKITDVVGAIDSAFTTFDSFGNPINDPYPTNFPSGGFDLDGVAALNQPNTTVGIIGLEKMDARLYPNPVQQQNCVYWALPSAEKYELSITNLSGQKIVQQEVAARDSWRCNKLMGYYIFTFTNDKQVLNAKVLVQ